MQKHLEGALCIGSGGKPDPSKESINGNNVMGRDTSVPSKNKIRPRGRK